MIRTFQRKSSNTWYEVVIINTETNRFESFCYEIFWGKLLKFSEYITTNDCKYWLANNRKWFKYEEVDNNFLELYSLWNPAISIGGGNYI